MLFTATVAALSALAAPVLAQQNFQVMVGMNGLSFTPSEVTAAAGDSVTFVFFPKNHTVTQSTFAAPCTPMPNGLNSGFQPVVAGAANVPAMTVPINDTNPLWFFCEQTAPAPHCGKGMVFAVNANANKTFAAFQAAANATGASTTTNSTGAPGTTGSTGSTGSTGTSPSSPASPSASTTGGKASGALGLTVRAAPLLAALGVVAGLLL